MPRDLDKTEVMPRVPQGDDTVIIHPLVGRLMQASMDQTHAVTNQVLGNLEREVAYQKAALALVRERVAALTERPYIVNPQMYVRALWPSHEDIEQRMIEDGYTPRKG